jgi:hypothetical protein
MLWTILVPWRLPSLRHNQLLNIDWKIATPVAMTAVVASALLGIARWLLLLPMALASAVPMGGLDLLRDSLIQLLRALADRLSAASGTYAPR